MASFRIQKPSATSAGNVYVKLRMKKAPMSPEMYENCGMAAATMNATAQYRGMLMAQAILPLLLVSGGKPKISSRTSM